MAPADGSSVFHTVVRLTESRCLEHLLLSGGANKPLVDQDSFRRTYAAAVAEVPRPQPRGHQLTTRKPHGKTNSVLVDTPTEKKTCLDHPNLYLKGTRDPTVETGSHEQKPEVGR